MSDKTPKPFTPFQEKVGRAMVRPFSKANAWLYRLSGGRVGGRWLRGAPVR